MSSRNVVRVRALAALIAAAATVLLTGCVGGAATAPHGAGTTTLHLVGYAVPKEANNAIQKKFAETTERKDVTWEESYGASGDQSRAVLNGLKADYVNFSLEGDVTRESRSSLLTPPRLARHAGTFWRRTSR
jgi:sulfate/thiosulfate transport system substrate-binding protein